MLTRRTKRSKTVLIENENSDSDCQRELDKRKIFLDLKVFLQERLEISEEIANKAVQQIFELIEAVKSESKADLLRDRPEDCEEIVDNSEEIEEISEEMVENDREPGENESNQEDSTVHHTDLDTTIINESNIDQSNTHQSNTNQSNFNQSSINNRATEIAVVKGGIVKNLSSSFEKVVDGKFSNNLNLNDLLENNLIKQTYSSQTNDVAIINERSFDFQNLVKMFEFK
jgi:hypothetical protein